MRRYLPSLFLFLIAASQVPAALAQTIVVKFSHVVAPDTPKGKAAEKFKQLAEAATKGRVKVEIYPNSQVSDFRALKMRVQSSKVLAATFRRLGAIPQVMAFSEVYTALQQGVVDGAENPVSNLYTQKMHEVQKHLTLSDHGCLVYAVITNKKFWDGLPADVRTALEQAMKEATRYERAIAAKENLDALAQVRASGKTEVYVLTDEERTQWRQTLLPVQQEFESVIGKDLIASVRAVAAQVADERRKR
ncbi:MAG: TRAP transporter substrate-binding protein DctP [Betaproteobacteria bacterium]|nr:TRAP transporter substrate-binding protein DctP [Betaproteobacteria bacterium]